MSNNMKPTEKAVAGETPSLDFTELMSQFRLPGVDFAALVDRERKNIEALAKANRIAFEGWQRLVLRQAEIFQETMKKVVAYAGQEAAKKRADLAEEGSEKALADMRELAEMATKSRKRPSMWFARGSKRTWKASETLETKLRMKLPFGELIVRCRRTGRTFQKRAIAFQGEQMRTYRVPKDT